MELTLGQALFVQSVMEPHQTLWIPEKI
jgi:hypothetical protein